MSTPFELLAFVAGHYGVLAVLLAAAWSVGRRLTERLGYRDGLDAAGVACALGLGVWSAALTLLALLGALRPLPVLALLAISQYVCRRVWIGAAQRVRRRLEGSLSIGRIAVAILVGILLVPLLSLPLYPPTAFDATMFHLPFAESIAEEGRIGFFETLRYPVFPALQEVLYATALLFRNDVVAATVHFGSFLLVALLLYNWGRWLASPRAGLWAALLWLGANAAVRDAMGAYVDCALALYVTAGLYALHRYFDRAERGWLVVAALLVGFAAATKYHGLYFVAAGTLGVAAYTLWYRRWRDLAAFGIALAAPLALWYGIVYLHTGSPVFPFFPAVFGLTPWAFELRYTSSVPMSRVDVGPLVFLYEAAVLARVLFNKAVLMLDQSLTKTVALPVEVLKSGGPFRGHPLSQLTLLALPLVALVVLRARHARYLAVVAGLYLLAWAGTAQELRYLIPVLPLLALLAAQGADRVISWLAPVARRPRLATVAAMALTLVLALQVYWVSSELSWEQGRPPVTAEQRDRYLELRVPSYAAIHRLNERHGNAYTVYALFNEEAKHFVAGEHVGDWFGPRRYATLLGKLHNRDALHRALTAMGADYLLVPDLSTWKQRLRQQYPPAPARRLAPHFELDYEDRYTSLYRVVPLEELPSGSGEPADGDERSGGTGRSGSEVAPGDQVVEPGDQPTEDRPGEGGPEEADDGADRRDRVAREVVTQQL